jgi:hypothetical protein
VTGMSGTGKSSELAMLARHGHRTVDTDDPGWIVQSQTPDGPEPLWDLERVSALLDRHRVGWLFIAGCVANQGALYDRFDAVVLLSAPQGACCCDAHYDGRAQDALADSHRVQPHRRAPDRRRDRAIACTRTDAESTRKR